MKILVTGGNGFLGRHVTSELVNKGHQAIPVGRANADLTDRSAVTKLLTDLRPDAIIHLAAKVGGIGANRLHPAEFFHENLLMGVHLIHAAYECGIKKTLVAGTVCAYPKFTPVPFQEADIWAGYPEETNAPYGIAKKALLVQLQAYRQQYGMNGIYVLPTNLYGPHDNFDPESSHVIPALISRLIAAREAGDESVTVWGTGVATREFLYVTDCSKAIVMALEEYDSPEPINLGSECETSIKELVYTIAELVNYRGSIVWDSTKPDGQPRRKLDTSRARQELGFVASTSLRDGLKATIDWWESRG